MGILEILKHSGTKNYAWRLPIQLCLYNFLNQNVSMPPTYILLLAHDTSELLITWAAHFLFIVAPWMEALFFLLWSGYLSFTVLKTKIRNWVHLVKLRKLSNFRNVTTSKTFETAFDFFFHWTEKFWRCQTIYRQYVREIDVDYSLFHAELPIVPVQEHEVSSFVMGYREYCETWTSKRWRHLTNTARKWCR